MLKDIPINKNVLLSEDKVTKKHKGNVINGNNKES